MTVGKIYVLHMKMYFAIYGSKLDFSSAVCSELKLAKIVQQGITNMYFDKVSTNNNTHTFADTTLEKF